MIDFQALAEKLRPMIVDTIPYLNKAIDGGKTVLVEGAQSNVLDIDFGKFLQYLCTTHPSHLHPNRSVHLTVQPLIFNNKQEKLLVKEFKNRMGCLGFHTWRSTLLIIRLLVQSQSG